MKLDLEKTQSREDNFSSGFLKASVFRTDLQTRRERMLKRRDQIRDEYLSSLAFKVMEGML